MRRRGRRMTIKFLQTASEICFGTAIAFAILAAALFFLLDIRENFLIETDCARRKTIDEMHERNRRTGKLREEDEEREGSSDSNKPARFGGQETIPLAECRPRFRVIQRTIITHAKESIPL